MLLINKVIFYEITKIKEILIKEINVRDINARGAGLPLLKKIKIYILNNIKIEARIKRYTVIIFLLEKFIVITGPIK